MDAFNKLYIFFFKLFLLYGFGAFTFLYSFAGPIVKLAFGNKFPEVAYNTQEMFLSMLVFPSAILQANISRQEDHGKVVNSSYTLLTVLEVPKSNLSVNGKLDSKRKISE